MQDRGLAAYIAELIGTLFLVFVVGTVVIALRVDQPDGADRLGLRRGRPRPRLRPLPADHRPRAGQRRALQPRGHDGRLGDAADRPGRRRRLHPRPALRRRARRAAGQGPAARRGSRVRLRRRRGHRHCSAATSPAPWSRRSGTFLLVLAVCAVAMNPRARQEWAPLAIGTTLGFVVMIFGPLTGGCGQPGALVRPGADRRLDRRQRPARLRPRPDRRRDRRRWRLPLRDRRPAVRGGRRAADLGRPRRRPGGQGRRGPRAQQVGPSGRASAAGARAAAGGR